METKHIVALMVLMVLACGSVVILTLSQRLRDFALFGLLFGAVFTEHMDVNFFGEYWYRGTARGVEISLIDLLALGLLCASLVAPRYGERKWFWPAGLGLLLVYFAYCVGSVGFAEPKTYGTWELVKVFRGILVLLAGALFVRTRRELSIVVLALCATIFVQTVYALKQRYLGGMFRVPGTLDHENSLSMYLCTVGPVLLAAALADWPKWLRIMAGAATLCAAVCELLTISRAGIPTFAFGMIGVAVASSSWRITKKKVALVSTITLVFGALIFKSWDQLAQRYESASLADEYLNEDAEGRGVYFRWANAIIEDHPFGIGLNNWSYYVSKIYGPQLGFYYEDYDDIAGSPEKADLPSIRYAAPAHSLAALTLGELGVAGLGIFLLVWCRWFQMGARFLRGRLDPDPMHRMGIGFLFAACGIFMQSVTEWTYRQTALQFTFHVLMGALASLYYAKRHATKPITIVERDDEIELEAEVLPAEG